jgi:hypothetical protein
MTGEAFPVGEGPEIETIESVVVLVGASSDLGSRNTMFVIRLRRLS